MKIYPRPKDRTVYTRDGLALLLDAADGPYYVYVLCLPPEADEMVPFYVGIGCGNRLFAHEEEALDLSCAGRKVEQIREIWANGATPIRVIDSFSNEVPWAREEELINEFGLQRDGCGILTNEQKYSPSFVHEGVELRKYASDGNRLPQNFVRKDARLRVGPRVPKTPLSVYGKICSVLERYPGVTGAELVELLLTIDFSDNKSAYTAKGAVSRPWLAKYIDGAFYAKNQFIQLADQE